MNDNISTSGKVTADDLELSDVFTGHVQIAEGVVNVLYKARRKGQWFVLKALRPEFRDDVGPRVPVRETDGPSQHCAALLP